MESKLPTLYDILAELDENFDYTKDCLPEEKCVSDEQMVLDKFHKFTRNSHCEENLEFFNKSKKFLLDDTYKEFELDDWNREIYKKFIKINSPMECNFPQNIREIFDVCHEAGEIPSQKDIANAIQHILGLLFDIYTRFSNQYHYQYIPASEPFTEKVRETQESSSSTRISTLRADSNDNIYRSSVFHRSRRFFNKFKR
ncbi:hypothetical protein KAFR_0J02000 [Kazachstania africana CBS 2517]|uniref:RGS domain-containing protein n=1 Tax=Kazachstania africana (strain ATCC 22294 / BCRC 22015 / CBS 2517 / CECT 1963 / NBRC 1671 / NRRL Y-8276) TaxID=1071382 RepID=H2B0W4_KAZAF|nr:hypothetical protein KAFR_0J02000 [Kazachstania africana CBS 2517]CCF60264.1 hypothetical protein KAFR_0J02000 [Kazachstania africana CBS 2517]